MPTTDTHGIASEQEFMISQLEDEVFRLTALLNAAALIAGSLEPDTVLMELVQQAALVLRAKAASLLLLDEAAGELVFRVAYGEKGADLVERRFPSDKGIAGAVATTGEPILIQDAQRDPRHLKQFDEELGFRTGSLLAVPVQVHGQVLGVLEVLNPDTVARFTEDDLSLLIAFAGQTGLALANAQVHSGMQRQLDLVAQSMQDGLVVLDRDGDVTLANPAARAMLGLPDTGDIATANLARAANDSAAFAPVAHPGRQEIRVEVPGVPPRSIRVTGAPMLDPAGQQVGTVLVMHDVSRERETTRLKNEMIATISHELRTPVASIQGSAQLLSDGTVDAAGPDGSKFVDIIQRNADRLAKLVSSIVDLAQLGSGNLEVTPGACPVKACIASVTEEAEAGIAEASLTLDVHIPADLPDVWADPRRVQQVLHHLLDNARKFTPPGGRIVVSATHDADTVTVRVKDTGPGIAAAARERAFEIFDQLSDPQRNKAPGTGLGLPIVRGIVEALGGRIWIEPEPAGGGAEIAFTLPINGGRGA